MSDIVRYVVDVEQLATVAQLKAVIGEANELMQKTVEFFNMHNKLREKYAAVRALDFPGKRLVTSLSNSFVDSRRIALEKYMQVHHLTH